MSIFTEEAEVDDSSNDVMYFILPALAIVVLVCILCVCLVLCWRQSHRDTFGPTGAKRQSELVALKPNNKVCILFEICYDILRLWLVVKLPKRQVENVCRVYMQVSLSKQLCHCVTRLDACHKSYNCT